ncbi:uncharacterized protein LOC135492603 isoform X2 [Lineus longissimus]|uniref:uncharacterized protein LOC135492603 isoform X2 n=1 Tax=Lineus longissimus TaxID=88925 RepID=UPI002B4E621B
MAFFGQAFYFLVLISYFSVVLSAGLNPRTFASHTSNLAREEFEEKRQENAAIRKVHIIYMNHLDVGFNNYLDNVINLYFSKYFPQAVQRAAELSDGGYDETFRYTTHPWLVSMYLDCPQYIHLLPGDKVKCPSVDEVKVFTRAVELGIITWHAGPMNMQYEFMDEALLTHAFNFTLSLDQRFNITRKYRTLSQRDVPGMTQAVIPVLVKQGIAAITVGVNAASSPPAVPRIFNWEYKGQRVLAMWHPNGYPDNPGRNPNNPGGLSVDDCVTIDGFDEAMCFAFRSDNQGPPQSLQEILGYYEILRKEFPGAKLGASYLEDFTAAVMAVRDKLPTITNEIGDTWIQGIQSDPRKVAEMRAFLRNRAECLKKGLCSYSDPRFFNSSRLLLKTAEHTWGRNGVWDTINWSNTAFQKVKNSKGFKNNEQAWLGQRYFTYYALKALGSHPLASDVIKEFTDLQAQKVDLAGYERDIDLQYKCKFGLALQFSNQGFIQWLSDNRSQIQWTSRENGLAKFQYVTYSQKDFDAMNAAYTYATWFALGLEKPNITKNAHPESKIWDPQLVEFYRKNDGSCDFYAHLEMKEFQTSTKYGAPPDIWIHYNVTNSKGIDVTVQWFNKPATRMPEGIFLSFQPDPRDGYGWIMSKSGQMVDPTNVVLNGSQRHHAIDRGVAYVNKEGTGIAFTSKDVALVSTVTKNLPPTAFPLPLHQTDEITGMSYNLFNNLWNVNYVFWYPYAPGDEDFKARFSINLVDDKTWSHERNPRVQKDETSSLRFKSYKELKEFEKL